MLLLQMVGGDSSLSLRNPEQISIIRAMCTLPKVPDHYFHILEETLDQNDLSIASKPCQKYNGDETGVPLDPAPPSHCSERAKTYSIHYYRWQNSN